MSDTTTPTCVAAVISEALSNRFPQAPLTHSSVSSLHWGDDRQDKTMTEEEEKKDKKKRRHGLRASHRDARRDPAPHRITNRDGKRGDHVAVRDVDEPI